MRTKLPNFLRSYVQGVYTIQNGANKRNGLTAYSVDGHNIVLNWMTEITDLLQFFVVSVEFGLDYASREADCLFDNLNVNFFLPFSQIDITYGHSRVLWWLLGSRDGRSQKNLTLNPLRVQRLRLRIRSGILFVHTFLNPNLLRVQKKFPYFSDSPIRRTRI